MPRTLHVHIGDPTEFDDVEATLSAIDAGAEPPARPSHLVLESLDTFQRVFRGTNLELLEAIVEHEPASIRALARAVDRHPPEVTENVRELADYGVIELEPDGRAKRPRLWYDEIHVEGDVSLTDLGGDSAESTPP